MSKRHRINCRIPVKDFNQLKRRAKSAMRTITEQLIYELRREQQLEGVPLDRIHVMQQHVFDTRMPENADIESVKRDGA